MIDFEKKREIVQNLRPIDDAFFHKLMEDRLTCQEMLRVILGEPELAVENVIPQGSIKNLQGRSVVLDALCKRPDGSFFNLEVQKKDDDNHLKRALYNTACIIANVTDPGTKFENVPDVCIVYITRFDVFKENRTIYHVDHTLRESNRRLGFGLDMVFVNTKVDDGSEIAELMACLESPRVDSPKFPHLSERVRQFKDEEKGLNAMYDLFDEYVNEAREEGMAKGIAKGMAEGRAEGRAEGMAEGKAEGMAKGKAEVIALMLQSGMGYEQLASSLKISVDKVKELESLALASTTG